MADRKTSNKKRVLTTKKYEEQKTTWPKEGKHILAQYDDESILVYQAYNKEIGEYAVKHQKFEGCPKFSPTRMTWIKTNFLWMMFRSGWGEKDANQVVTLGVWLKRSAFEKMLEHAVHSGFKPSVYGTADEYNKCVSKAKNDAYGFVRLQWDPDHSPSGSPHPRRRAIQLGLKGVKSYISGEDIIQIQDLSAFVNEQSIHKGSPQSLVTPEEKPYIIQDKALAQKLMLAEWNSSSPTDDGVYDKGTLVDDEEEEDNTQTND